MDKNIKRKLAIFLIILLQIISCRDKDHIKPGYQRKAPAPEFYRIRINDEVRSYLWAKAGSYWIYKNTTTGDLDTQVCAAFVFDSLISKGTEDYSKHITIEYDRIRRNIQSTYNNWVYFDATPYNTPNARYFNNGRLILDRSVAGEGIIAPFTYYFELGTGSGNGSSNTYFKGITPTLTLQGKNYTNVALFDVDKDDIWERKLSCIRSNNIYYWAKDVGLIKKEMKTCNMSWELIEYNIIK